MIIGEQQFRKNPDIRGKKLFSTVAPSSGTITLSALKIFEGFDGSAQDDDPAINLTTHHSELDARADLTCVDGSRTGYQVCLRPTSDFW